MQAQVALKWKAITRVTLFVLAIPPSSPANLSTTPFHQFLFSHILQETIHTQYFTVGWKEFSRLTFIAFKTGLQIQSGRSTEFRTPIRRSLVRSFLIFLTDPRAFDNGARSGSFRFQLLSWNSHVSGQFQSEFRQGHQRVSSKLTKVLRLTKDSSQANHKDCYFWTRWISLKSAPPALPGSTLNLTCRGNFFVGAFWGVIQFADWSEQDALWRKEKFWGCNSETWLLLFRVERARRLPLRRVIISMIHVPRSTFLPGSSIPKRKPKVFTWHFANEIFLCLISRRTVENETDRQTDTHTSEWVRESECQVSFPVLLVHLSQTKCFR